MHDGGLSSVGRVSPHQGVEDGKQVKQSGDAGIDHGDFDAVPSGGGQLCRCQVGPRSIAQAVGGEGVRAVADLGQEPEFLLLGIDGVADSADGDTAPEGAGDGDQDDEAAFSMPASST